MDLNQFKKLFDKTYIPLCMYVLRISGSTIRSHHGSARLGLTSGAFNIDGPIGSENTTYSFAVRRSWFDVASMPSRSFWAGV